VAHGVGIGTDRSTAWVLTLSLACVLAVVTATAWRLAAAARLGRVQ
jgi:predicted outer membrane lipoprotein